MTMFWKKAIKVSISLAEGTFDDKGNNEIILPEVPIHISMDKTGGDELPKCSIEVKNLKLNLMEQLTVLSFLQLQTYNNVIKVMAGEEGRDLDLVFQGEIVSAIPVFSTDGDVTFKIEAASGYYPLQKSTPPVSVQGETTIEYLMKQFAAEAGYALENKGVTGSVSNSVFAGTPIVKARLLAKQTGIDLLIDNNKFVILPSYKDNRDCIIPLISKDTGLIGYPSFTNDGVECECLFNPLIEIGGLIKLESIVPKATGVWRVTKIHHDLEAYNSGGGNWHTKIDAVWRADS